MYNVIERSEVNMLVKLTDNELSIMKAMWREEKPFTRSDMLNLIENRPWKENSIHGLINSLLEKGVIKVDGIVETGKTFGRTYVPMISEEEYDLMQLELTLNGMNSGKSTFLKYLTNLVKSDELEDDDFEKLESIVTERKGR